MQLVSAHYKNVVVFDDLELDLENNGLVVISGRNLDSTAKNNRNGVGKSLLLTPLANLAFEADPLSTQKRGAKKGLLSKETSISFCIRHANKLLSVTQSAKGYEIEIDGKPIKKMDQGKQSAARDWIKQFIPMTEDEFYSYCYIHTQRAHPFQRAKPSDRLSYITSIFDLDVYDRLRVYFGKKLSEVKDKVKTAEVYAEELRSAQQTLSGLTKTGTKKLKLAVDELGAEIEDLSARRRTLDVDAYSYKQILKVKKQLEEYDEVENPEAVLAMLDKAMDECDAYDEYKNEFSAYEKARSSIKNAIKELGDSDPKYDQDELDADTLVAKKCDLNLSRAVSELEELESDIKKLKKQIAELPEPKFELEEAREELGVAKRTLSMCEDLDGEKECPTCATKLDADHISGMHKQAKKVIKFAEASIAYYKVDEKLKDLLPRVPELEADISKAEKKIKKICKAYGIDSIKALTKLVEANNDAVRAKAERKRLKLKLKELEEPVKVKKPKQDRKTIQENGRALTKYIGLLDQLKGLHSVDKDPRPELEEVVAEHVKKAAKYRKLNDELAAIQLANSRYKFTQEAIENLQSKLEGMDELLESKKCFEMMYKAYSNTKLKLVAANEVLGQLQNEVNALAPLVFTESMKFTFTTDKQGVVAQVTRNNGITSDIQHLSGAESNCFRLLFALALLTFVPPDRRPDFMVLDEPDANMSDGARLHLIKEFLPKLQSVVPNIYWITPAPTDAFSSAQHWVVVKKNGKSKLEIR